MNIKVYFLLCFCFIHIQDLKVDELWPPEGAEPRIPNWGSKLTAIIRPTMFLGTQVPPRQTLAKMVPISTLDALIVISSKSELGN